MRTIHGKHVLSKSWDTVFVMEIEKRLHVRPAISYVASLEKRSHPNLQGENSVLSSEKQELGGKIKLPRADVLSAASCPKLLYNEQKSTIL